MEQDQATRELSLDEAVALANLLLRDVRLDEARAALEFDPNRARKP